MYLLHAWSQSKHHHLIRMTKNYVFAPYRNSFMPFELFSPFTNKLNHISFPFLPLIVLLRFIVLRYIYLSMHVSANKCWHSIILHRIILRMSFETSGGKCKRGDWGRKDEEEEEEEKCGQRKNFCRTVSEWQWHRLHMLNGMSAFFTCIFSIQMFWHFLPACVSVFVVSTNVCFALFNFSLTEARCKFMWYIQTICSFLL